MMSEDKLVHPIAIRHLICPVSVVEKMQKGKYYTVPVEHDGPKLSPIESYQTQASLICNEMTRLIKKKMEGSAYKVTEYKIAFEGYSQQWNVEIDLMSEKSSDELNKNNNQ